MEVLSGIDPYVRIARERVESSFLSALLWRARGDWDCTRTVRKRYVARMNVEDT